MKINTILFVLILSCILLNSNDRTKSMSIENDFFIESIKRKLPKNWTVKIEDNKLIFERKGEIWIKQENKINAPINPKKEKDSLESFKKNGIKAKCQMTLRFEKRNSIDIYFNKIKENITTRDSINKLPSKYNIDKLIDPNLSRKGEPFYIPKTDEEKIRIDQYYKEKFELEKKLNLFPHFYIENFILYLDNATGLQDEFHSVYPEKASEELYSILEMVKANLATLFYDQEQDISNFNNRIVFMSGKISDIPYQHMISIPKNYENASYLDINKNQLVIYTKTPVKSNKKIELIGKVILLGGTSKRPGSKQKYSEYQIIVDYWNYIN